MFGVIGLAVALNVALQIILPRNHMLTEQQTAWFLAYDIGQLGLLLFLTGGLLNPFSLLLLAPVTISASLLNARTTALVCLPVCWPRLFFAPLPWLGVAPQIPGYCIGMVALLLAVVFIPTYVYGVSREGRRMSDALTATHRFGARTKALGAGRFGGSGGASAWHAFGHDCAGLGQLAGRDDLPEDLREDVALMREALRCRNILTDLVSEESDPVVAQTACASLWKSGFGSRAAQ